jgi:LacI family repressor for deo operon, udp, cdd, tsx, nupC, and nupG
MEQLQKTPTILDVARVAKVSTATVSRALSNPERVKQSTRDRIFLAVEATGYTANQSARSLRQQNSRTILVALPDIRNPFFSTILDAIEREATRRGYGVLVANRFLGTQPGRRIREYFVSNRADGLLLLDGSIALEELLQLRSGHVFMPLVVACEEIAQAPFRTVTTDNAYAAFCATRHLIDLGHRRLGHIRGPGGNPLTAEREQGFRRALREADIVLHEEWMFPGNFEMQSGAAAAERYLALSKRPEAVFAANDESAIGFVAGLRQHGLECPRDVSVVGFDDLAIASHFWPPLTTMRQPREALGRLAAEALIDLIEGQSSGRVPQHIVLSSELIVRGSTAPAVSAASV